MDKANIPVKIAWILVGVIFIFLALSAGTANSNLASEKVKTASLSAQVADLETKLSIAKSDVSRQILIAQDLQRSLDEAKTEVERLRVANNDLEARINAATLALQTAGSEESSEEVSEATPEATPATP